MATRKTRLNTDSPTPNSGSETTPLTPTSEIKKRITRKIQPKSVPTADDKEEVSPATSAASSKKSSILSPSRIRSHKLTKADLIAQIEDDKLSAKGKRLKRATIGSIVEFKSTRGKRKSLPVVVKKEIKRRNSADVIDRKQSARLNKDKALRSGRARKSVVSAVPEKVARVVAKRKRLRTSTDKTGQASKLIKIEPDDGAMSDSELLNSLPRSDSISKCSETDTSSIDIPLNMLKEESLLMSSQKSLLLDDITDDMVTEDEVKESMLLDHDLETGKTSPSVSENLSEVTADVADVAMEDAKKEIDTPVPGETKPIVQETVTVPSLNDSGIVGDSSDSSQTVKKRPITPLKISDISGAVATAISSPVILAKLVPEPTKKPKRALIRPKFNTPLRYEQMAPATPAAPVTVSPTVPSKEVEAVAIVALDSGTAVAPVLLTEASAVPDDNDANTKVDAPEGVDTSSAIAETTKASDKQKSPSPGPVSEGISAISVKQFYGQPDFLENNLGIEEDPKLAEIVQVHEKTKLTEDKEIVKPIDKKADIEEKTSESEDTATDVLAKDDELKFDDSIESETELEDQITEELSEAVLLEEDEEESEPEPPKERKIKVGNDSKALITANGVHISPKKIKPNDGSTESLKEEKPESKAEPNEQSKATVEEIKHEKIELPSKEEPMDVTDPSSIIPVEPAAALKSTTRTVEEAEAILADVVDDTKMDIVDAEPENKENILSNFKHTVQPATPISSPNRPSSDDGTDKSIVIAESPETRKQKESHLLTLGLLTHRAAVAAKIEKQKRREQLMSSNSKTGAKRSSDYTGTLKTVIKLHRPSVSGEPPKAKKPGRPPGSLKMTLHKGRSKGTPTAVSTTDKETHSTNNSEEDTYYTIQNEARHGSDHTATHGGQSRKSFNRSHTGDATVAIPEPIEPAVKEAEKALVIPEKASSFRIHPDKLCQDQCFYCGGKFGLFDTPCHVASIKSLERQKKILDNEEKLTVDNCLCDACFRHVDRRANCPSYKKRIMGSSNTVADFHHSSLMQQQQQNNEATSANEEPNEEQNDTGTSGSSTTQIRATGCQVVDCTNKSSHVIRRKWFLKMRKQIGKLLNLNATPTHPITYLSICSNHYNVIGHLMVCTLCKRRLVRNHIYYITQNIPQLEQLLSAEGIPVTIGPSPVVCKLCRYFSNLLLKPLEQPQKTGFVREYKRRLLQFYNVDVMDETDTDSQPSAKAGDQSPPLTSQISHNQQSKKGRAAKRPRKSSRAEDSMSLPSSVESVHEEDAQATVVSQIEHYDVQHILDNNAVTLVHKPKAAVQKGAQQSSAIVSLLHKSPQVLVVGEPKRPNKEDLSMLRANPNISMRELFPGEEEMGLHVNVPFGSTHGHRTPEGWTKVINTIQYDEPTRHLWEELQKPYGNQSSFLRHLILLEKYFRNGDLILSANAGCNAVNYTESVQHRLQAFDSVRRRSSDASPPATSAAVPLSTNITLNQMYNLSHNSPITIIPTGNSSTAAKAAGKSKPSATETTSLLKQQHYEQPPPSGRPKRHSVEAKAKSTGMPPELICINTSNKQPINMQQSIQQFVAAAAASAAANSSTGVSVSLQPTTTPAAVPVAGTSSTTPQKPTKSAQNSLLIPQPSTSAGSSAKKSSTATTSTKTSAVPAAAPHTSPAVPPSGQIATAKEPNVIRLPESLTQAERLESKTWRPTLMPVSAGPPALNGQLYQTADGRKLPNLVQVQSGGNPYLISIHDYNRMCILRRERLFRDQMISRNPGGSAAVQQMQLNQHLLKQYMQQQQQTHHQQQQEQQQQQQQQQQNQSKSSTATKSTPQPSGSGTNTSTSSTTNNTINSARVNIPNKILEQNSVIPIPSGAASKSSALDSLLKVRKSNPTSLLKPNMHITAKSSQQASVNATTTANVANVISITSTPSISSILSAQQQQQQELQHATNLRMIQSQQLIQQHILEQQRSYQQQHSATMPSTSTTSALDAMLKTTQKATDMKMWDWTHQQKGDNTGSNVVIDNTAAKLLSKIPKSLTVIPQQKHHRSSSSKSSGDGNAST